MTKLYQQNVSKFLLVCDASLTRQTIIANPSQPNQRLNNNHHIATTSFSWMGDAARSLALRSATSPFFVADTHNNHHDVDTDSRKSSKHKLNKNDTATAAIRTTTPPTMLQSSINSWSDCICMACGTLLLPPPPPPPTLTPVIDDDVFNAIIVDETNQSSTTPSLLPVHSHISLRPLKRGKTRRRRASRVKAKELHNRTLSLQRRGGGNTNNNNNNNSSSVQILRNEILQKEQMQRMASMYNLGDGRAKNCIVIQCTFCGQKKKRKGMEIKKSILPHPPLPKSSSPKMGVVHAKNKCGSQKKNNNNIIKPTSEKVDVSTQIRDNTDFISLDSIKMSDGIAVVGMGRDARTRKQGGDINGQNEIVSPILVLQGGRKKKKKKRPETTKTSALMDFLSSLND